jgi:hypothetical protein
MVNMWAVLLIRTDRLSKSGTKYLWIYEVREYKPMSKASTITSDNASARRPKAID